MTTLADIQTTLSRELRDISFATFSTAELADWINRGIDSIADVYPKETTDYSITIAASVFTYAPTTSLSRIYRVDVHNSSGSYLGIIPKGIGDGRDSGWEWHAGILWLPPNYPVATGNKLRVFGYARYIQLSATTSTTEMDQSAINAVIAFATSEAMYALANDRAKFQQWQATPGNSDVSLLGIASTGRDAERRWRREQTRMRRMRKLG